MIDPAKLAPIDRDEMRVLAAEEYRRIDDLLRDLSFADWQRQTICPDWDVQDMVAHLLGAAEANASFREMVTQSIRGARWARAHRRPQIDGINAVQVADRDGLAPSELIEHLAEVAPRAIAGRHRTPQVVRRISIPDPVDGRLGLGRLMDVIYTRDQWLHRVDISRATNRFVELTDEHDGRIIGDVVADWARSHGKPFELVLTGPGGGKFGTGDGPRMELGAVEFCWAVSGRGGQAPLETRVLF